MLSGFILLEEYKIIKKKSIIIHIRERILDFDDF